MFVLQKKKPKTSKGNNSSRNKDREHCANDHVSVTQAVDGRVLEDEDVPFPGSTKRQCRIMFGQKYYIYPQDLELIGQQNMKLIVPKLSYKSCNVPSHSENGSKTSGDEADDEDSDTGSYGNCMNIVKGFRFSCREGFQYGRKSNPNVYYRQNLYTKHNIVLQKVPQMNENLTYHNHSFSDIGGDDAEPLNTSVMSVQEMSESGCDTIHERAKYHHQVTVQQSDEESPPLSTPDAKTRVYHRGHLVLSPGTASPKGYKCKFCNKIWQSLKYLKAHEETHKKAQYQCEFCQKMIPMHQEKEHRLFHAGATNDGGGRGKLRRRNMLEMFVANGDKDESQSKASAENQRQEDTSEEDIDTLQSDSDDDKISNVSSELPSFSFESDGGDGDMHDSGTTLKEGELFKGDTLTEDGALKEDDILKEKNTLEEENTLKEVNTPREDDTMREDDTWTENDTLKEGNTLKEGYTSTECDTLREGDTGMEDYTLREGDTFREGDTLMEDDSLMADDTLREGDSLREGGTLRESDREGDTLMEGDTEMEDYTLREGDTFREGDTLMEDDSLMEDDTLREGDSLREGDREGDTLMEDASSKGDDALKEDNISKENEDGHGSDRFVQPVENTPNTTNCQCEYCTAAGDNNHETSFTRMVSMFTENLTYIVKNKISCKRCHQSFPVQCEVIRHERTHLDINSNECGQCRQVFHNEKHRIEHEKKCWSKQYFLALLADDQSEVSDAHARMTVTESETSANSQQGSPMLPKSGTPGNNLQHSPAHHMQNQGMKQTLPPSTAGSLTDNHSSPECNLAGGIQDISVIVPSSPVVMLPKINFCNTSDFVSLTACNENSKKEQTYKLLKTEKVNGKTIVKCGKCMKTFKGKSHALEHIAGHTGWKPYRCLKCPYAARCSSSLRSHKLNGRCGKKAVKLKSAESQISKSAARPGKPHHAKYDKLEKETLNLLRIKGQFDGKTFECGVCEKQLKRKRDAVEHIAIHTGWKPYRCPKCNFAARCESTFRYHKLKCGRKGNRQTPLSSKSLPVSQQGKAVHTNPTSAKLKTVRTSQQPASATSPKSNFQVKPQKPIQWNSASTIDEHKEETFKLMKVSKQYDGKKRFHCRKCKKTFKQKGHALEHISEHTGWKPFRCPSCPYAARCGSSLRSHKLSGRCGRKAVKIESAESQISKSSAKPRKPHHGKDDKLEKETLNLLRIKE